MNKAKDVLGPIVVYSVAIFTLVSLFLMVPVVLNKNTEKKQYDVEQLVKERKEFIGKDQTVDVVKVIPDQVGEEQYFTVIVETPKGRKIWRVNGEIPLEKEKWKVEIKEDGKVHFIKRILSKALGD